MCILLCRIKTMKFIFGAFISTARWLQRFHKSTKIIWSTGGDRGKICSKMKLNLGCKFTFSLQHSSKLCCWWIAWQGENQSVAEGNSPCFCLTPGTCLPAVTKIWIAEPQPCAGRSSGAAHTKDPLWLLSLSLSPVFGCSLTLRCLWTRAGNSSATTPGSQVGAGWVWILLQPHPWVIPESLTHPVPSCAFSRVSGTPWFVFLLFEGLLRLCCDFAF